MKARNGYSILQIGLHWLIALLILGAWFTHDGMEHALDARIAADQSGLTGNPLHVWLGGAAFVLILIRIIVRFTSGAPGAVPGTSPLMEMAALWGHRALYALMVLTPALGAMVWYGGVEAAADAHEMAGNALFFLALGHAAVALWHQYVKKDGVLLRMMRPEA